MKKKWLSDEIYARHEQHRHECELRMIVSMKSKEDWQRYLEGVEKERGTAAADRLRVDLLTAWKNRE